MWIKERLWQECFLTVVKENSGAFYRYAYSVLLNQQDAEDAVSETVLKAFEHLSDLRCVSKMRSWMFQILANTCRTSLIKRQKAFDFKEGDLKILPQREEYMDLRECIYRMEPKFREVVLLYYFEDLKTREIAEILEISEGTVKSRLSRARDKLRVYLGSSSN